MAEQQRVSRRAALQIGAIRMKGGLGSASRPFGTAGVVGAIAVTNSLGNFVARDAATYLQENPQVSHAGSLTSATTLVVATNAALDKTNAARWRGWRRRASPAPSTRPSRRTTATW